MQRAILTIAFDDGYLDTYRYAISYLDKLGIKSTFAVPAGLVGKTCEKRPLLNWNHVNRMARKGHEIASHTQYHIKVKSQKSKVKSIPNVETSLEYHRDPEEILEKKTSFGTSQKLKVEIVESKHMLEKKLGRRLSSFVYPYLDKFPSKFVQDIVMQNYSSSRISKNFPVFNKLPIKNPFALKGFCIMIEHPLSYLAEQIDKTIKDGLWLIEVFHLIGKKNTKSAHRNKPYRFFMHIDDFRRHIDFILSKKIKIMTQEEAVKAYAG